MSLIRPFVPIELTDSFASKVAESVNANNVFHGQGLSVTKHGNSTSVSVISQRIPTQFNLRGNFNPDEQYFPNDVVTVDQNLSYVINGATASINVGGSSLTDLAAGLFMCTNYVPPAWQTSTYLSQSILPAFQAAGGTVTDDMSDHYRHSFNRYYPTYPTQSGTGRVSENTWTTVYSQSYWVPLAPASSPGGGINWRGNYTTSSAYTKGDLVVVFPYDTVCVTTTTDNGSYTSSKVVSTMPGYYIALKNMTQGSTKYIPVQPSSSYWYLLEPFPASKYCITSMTNNNYYQAVPLNQYTANTASFQSNTNSFVYIAKPPRFRQPGGSGNTHEIIDGIDITYWWLNNNNRVANDALNGLSENQIPFPPYQVGPSNLTFMSSNQGTYNSTASGIYVVEAFTPYNGTGVSIAGGPNVYLQEFSPARVWMAL